MIKVTEITDEQAEHLCFETLRLFNPLQKSSLIKEYALRCIFMLKHYIGNYSILANNGVLCCKSKRMFVVRCDDYMLEILNNRCLIFHDSQFVGEFDIRNIEEYYEILLMQGDKQNKFQRLCFDHN
jgi:hypothetical protein